MTATYGITIKTGFAVCLAELRHVGGEIFPYCCRRRIVIRQDRYRSGEFLSVVVDTAYRYSISAAVLRRDRRAGAGAQERMFSQLRLISSAVSLA